MQSKLKSFPSHTALREGGTDLHSLALSQTPVYTARPWIWNLCIVRCACLYSSFQWYSLHPHTEGWPGWVDLGNYTETAYPFKLYNQAQCRVPLQMVNNTLATAVSPTLLHILRCYW